MVFVDQVATSFASPATLVEYFAKACPHCVHLQPVWAAAKSHGIDGVNFVAKECYDDKWNPGKDFSDCKAHGVEAFPTLKLYKAGDTTGVDVPPLLGGTTEDRTKELLDYVNSQLNNVKEQSMSWAAPFCLPIRGGRLSDFL